jgi:hypothetical protein
MVKWGFGWLEGDGEMVKWGIVKRKQKRQNLNQKPANGKTKPIYPTHVNKAENGLGEGKWILVFAKKKKGIKSPHHSHIVQLGSQGHAGLNVLVTFGRCAQYGKSVHQVTVLEQKKN